MDFLSNGGAIGARKLYKSNIYEDIIYVGGVSLGGVGTTSNITIPLTSLTGGIAAAPSPGDLVIVAVNYASTTNIAYNISGYTELVNIYISDTFDVNLMVGYQIMSGIPDTSITLTGGSGSIDNAFTYIVQVWRNVDPNQIFDVSPVTTSSGNTGIPNPPAIRATSSEKSEIIVVGAAATDGGADTFTASYLSPFLSVGANDVNDAILGMGGITGSFPTGYDPAAWTSSQADTTTYSTASATFALLPKLKYSNSGIWKIQETELESIDRGIIYPSFVSATTQSANSTSIPVPSARRAGDLLIYVIAADNAAAGFPAIPTGFTLGGSTGNTSGGLAWSYKISDGTETTISPIDNSRTTETIHAALLFRNARVSNPGTAQTTTGATITPPTIAAKYRELAVILTSQDTSTSLATGPAGYTEIVDAVGTGSTLYAGIKQILVDGTETPGAVSYAAVNSDSDYSATFTLAYAM